jgi:hypothetical protein
MKIQNDTRWVQIFGYFFCVTVIMYAYACTSIRSVEFKEPKIIIVRNNSGIDFIAVVKKTFRYPNVFFYNRLYRNSLFRNFIMESGIISLIYLR